MWFRVNSIVKMRKAVAIVWPVLSVACAVPGPMSTSIGIQPSQQALPTNAPNTSDASPVVAAATQVTKNIYISNSKVSIIQTPSTVGARTSSNLSASQEGRGGFPDTPNGWQTVRPEVNRLYRAHSLSGVCLKRQGQNLISAVCNGDVLLGISVKNGPLPNSLLLFSPGLYGYHPEGCLTRTTVAGIPNILPCDSGNREQVWLFDHGMIRSNSNICITANEAGRDVRLDYCGARREQLFVFE